MKKIFFCVILTCVSLFSLYSQSLPVAPYLPAQTSRSAKEAPITLQYPYEKMTAPTGAKNMYVFGRINLPELDQTQLDINGQAVPLYKNGTFIAYLPVEQGDFSFVLTATTPTETFQAVRHITVPGKPLDQFAGKARFDEAETYPSRPLWVLPGDMINLITRGTPGAQVTADLPSLKGGKQIALREDTRNPGTYRAKFVVSDKEKPRSSKIVYQMYDPHTDTRTKITARQRVKILDKQEPLQAAKVTSPNSKMRQIAVHQGSLYPFYRAFGEVLIDGRDNGLYRLRLGNGESAWLEEKKLSFTSSFEPNTIEEIDTLALPDKTQIRWTQSQPVSISIQEFNNRMEVVFYYTQVFEENFNIDSTSPLLDHVEWETLPDNIIKFILYFKEGATPWGHAYQYEKNNFLVELNHQPTLTSADKQPLTGARILLDAGHSPKRTPPYDGLVSPSGVLEYEANLALTEVLKKKLEAAGATVIMTRQGDNQMSLTARYRKALKEQAHIFVSLHHNALPETVNPLAVPRGYSIYYTYPHSFKLAQSVYQSFTKNIPLADNGLIANDILFIPRISEMPSILIENAYMILPEQEALVMSDEGRELFAQTIYEGILDFYGVAPKKPAAANKKKSAKASVQKTAAKKKKN